MQALGRHLGGGATVALDRLLPRRPWQEEIPDSILRRSEVVAAVDWSARARLYEALVALIGIRHTAVLFEYLPPVPAAALQASGYRFG